MKSNKQFSDKHQSTASVWELPIRLFHWLLVAVFLTSYLSSEWESLLHIYSGYGLIGLLLFRVLWGIWGSHKSRFSHFPLGRNELMNHLKALQRGTTHAHVGHNPLGALMIVAMLLTLTGIAASGLALSIEEHKGPVAEWFSHTPSETQNQERKSAEKHEAQAALQPVPDDEFRLTPEQQPLNKVKQPHKEDEHEEEWLEELHEFLVNLMIGLILLHICGVGISSRLEKVNYIKRITTGDAID